MANRKMKDSGVEWIGKIPEGWDRVSLLNLLKTKITDGPHETPTLVDDGIPFISVDSLKDSKTVDLSVVKKFISEDLYREYYKKASLESGDILFSKSATIGKTAIVDDRKFMVWSPLAILKVDQTCADNNYIYYVLNCEQLIEYTCLLGTSNTQVNVGMRALEKAKVPKPTKKEQQKIAAYLDKQCSAIDDVLAKTQESIEEYKKLKQAVITEAVTKGVRGKRPMKDSGIDWIGQIPKEWKVQRIKSLFDLRTELNYKPLEEVNLISLYTDRGVVQHADLEKTTGNKAMNADGYKIVHENDIVVNIILCWMGAIGRSAYNGVTSPAYDVYAPKESVDCEFYHHYFRTAGFNGECFTRGRGIMLMRWRTYSDQFRDIRVVVPSLEEQREIVQYLNKKCAAIDTLISKKQQFIDELTAYKKSLIYEYVTGKKEVPA